MSLYTYIYIYIHVYIYIYIHTHTVSVPIGRRRLRSAGGACQYYYNITCVAIFYPFSQFCEITISLLSLQKQPNTAPNVFQRGVEYGKYDNIM